MRFRMFIIGMVMFCWIGVWNSGARADHVRSGQIHIQLATVPEFKPFIWQEEGVAKGIDVDIVQEICRRMDMVCDISFHPWKRVLASLESGKTDGGFSGFRTKERERFANFMVHPLHLSTYNLFVKKGHEFEYEKIEDLYGRTIGMNRGFNLHPDFDEAVARGKIKIQEVDDLDQNIRKLLAGSRIDAIAANYHEMQLKITGQGLRSKITCLPNSITPPRPSYLMISKKWSTPHDREHLIRHMDQTLKSMYDDGFIDMINSRYLD